MMHRIFVYGTIKVGQPNHDFLHSAGPNKHNFVGTGQTESKWRLVIENKYNWPYLLDCEGEGNNVKGEVYEVDDELFKELDKAELHEQCYIRKKIHVRMENKSEANHGAKDETGSESTGGGSGETESESKEETDDPGSGSADESDVLECWAYMFHKFLPRMRSLTTFEAYDNDGDHGKPMAPVYDKVNAVWTVPFDDLHKEVCNWHLDLDDEVENDA